MRKVKKGIISLLVFVLVCNLPPFTGILTGVFVDMIGTQFAFITKDLHYFSAGGIKILENAETYKAYKRKYPNLDHTLYRTVSERNYFWFWRYGEYIVNPNWRAPFIQLPPGFNDVPYYGDDQDDFPPYRWNEKLAKWQRIEYKSQKLR